MSHEAWLGVVLATVAPMALLALTGFVKASVVLAAVRNALGASDVPSGLVTTAIALLLAVVTMAPTALAVAQRYHETSALHSQPDPLTVPAERAPRRAPREHAASTQNYEATGSATPLALHARPSAKAPAVRAAPTARAAASSAAPAPSVAPLHVPVAAPSAGANSWPDAASASGASTTPGATAPGANAPGATTPGANAPGANNAPDANVALAWGNVLPAAYRAQLERADEVLAPLRAFLFRHSGAAERATFARVLRADSQASAARHDDLWVLAPAFVATELRKAFWLALLVMVPFLLIDLLVAVAIAATGLTAMPHLAVALPLKLLLFVSVDGWRLLLEALLVGYQ